MDAFDRPDTLANQLILDLSKFRKSPVLIGVDGNDGVGKTPLAKKLSLLLSVPIVSLDEFLPEQGNGVFVPSLKVDLIHQRLATRHQTFLIDGICLLAAAKRCGFNVDKLIYVKNISTYDGHWYDEHELYPDQGPNITADYLTDMKKEIIRYHAEYKPDKKADYEFHWVESD